MEYWDGDLLDAKGLCPQAVVLRRALLGAALGLFWLTLLFTVVECSSVRGIVPGRLAKCCTLGGLSSASADGSF